MIDLRYANGLRAIKEAQDATHEQQLNEEAGRTRARLLVISAAVAVGVPIMCALNYYLAVTVK